MPDRTDAADDVGGAAPGDSATDGPGHRLAVDFEYASERRARVLAESVRVEVGEVPGERSTAAVDREGRAVSVGIDAADLVALRAGANTWVRLVRVAEDVAAACDGRTASAASDRAPDASE